MIEANSRTIDKLTRACLAPIDCGKVCVIHAQHLRALRIHFNKGRECPKAIELAMNRGLLRVDEPLFMKGIKWLRSIAYTKTGKVSDSAVANEGFQYAHNRAVLNTATHICLVGFNDVGTHYHSCYPMFKVCSAGGYFTYTPYPWQSGRGRLEIH